MAAEGERSGTYRGRTGITLTTPPAPTTPPAGYMPGLPPAWYVPPVSTPSYIPGQAPVYVPPASAPSFLSNQPSEWKPPPVVSEADWQAAQNLPPIGAGFRDQALQVLSRLIGGGDQPLVPPAAPLHYSQAWQARQAPALQPPSEYIPGVPPAWQSTGPGVPRPTIGGTPGLAVARPFGPTGSSSITPIAPRVPSAPVAPRTTGLGTAPLPLLVPDVATPAYPAPYSYGGGGGGGGGGYYGTTPTTTTTEGLPVVYATWFESLFGSLATYYTPERGGMGQAYKDYQSLMYLWQSLTGSLPTIEQLNGMLSVIGQRLRVLGRAPTFDDVLDYVKYLASPRGNPPAVSYLRVGEV